AGGQHVRVAGAPLGAVVPAAVVVVPVTVVLAVGQVVLALVCRRVGQGVPVVAGDVVDRGDRAPVGVSELVGGAGDAGRQVAHAVSGTTAQLGGHVGQPHGAHGVAEAVVPLGERRGELPGPPAVHPDVPRLGDE